MNAPTPDEDERLLARLNKFPRLRDRFERLVDIVEAVGDDLRKADDAEERVIAQVRRLGHEVLEGWAGEQVPRRSEAFDRTPGISREGKKNSVGTARSEKSK